MCAARSTRHPAVVDLAGSTAALKQPKAPKQPKAKKQPKAPTQPRAATTSTASRPTPPGPGRRPGLRRWWLPALAAGAAVVVAAVVGVDILTGTDTGNPVAAEKMPAQDDSGLPVLNLPTPDTATPDPDAATPDVAPATGEDCRADRGDQNSAEGAIRAFQYAYYVRRDGAAARSVIAPISTVAADGPAFQGFIDALPPGTSYCLDLTEIGPGLFASRLTELRPAAPPQLYAQNVVTTEVDGRWFIEAFQ